MAEGDAADARLPLELFGEGEKSFWGVEDGFPCEFRYDMGSDHLTSSASSTTETESDNDDYYLDALTRQMAHSFLLDDDDTNPKVCENMASSPQSTLCGMQRSPCSGESSPNGQPLSPTVAAPVEEQVTLLRLHAQAQSEKFYGSVPLDAPSKDYYPAQEQLKLKLQQQQQQQMRKQQGAWARQSKVGRAADGVVGRCCRPLGLSSSSSAWPPLQAQHPPPPQQHQARLGPGKRAAFLQSVGRRTSTGTGVFLPQAQRNENHAQPRKKTACTTVVLPARVVQALNLNMENMGLHPHLPGAFVLDHDAGTLITTQRTETRPTSTSEAALLRRRRRPHYLCLLESGRTNC